MTQIPGVPKLIDGFDIKETPDLAAFAEGMAADCERIAVCARTCLPANTRFTLILLQQLLSVHEDARAVHLAIKNRQFRALLVLSRGLFENCINTMRLAVGGEEIANTMFAHANQKFFRDLNRESSIEGGWTIQKKGPDPNHFPEEIKQSLGKYTRKSGNEQTGWIEETIEDKIQAISAKCQPYTCFSMQLALLGIYRHSSEVIHGTYFGTLFSLGHGIDKDIFLNKQLEKARNDRAGIVAHSANEIAVCLIEVVSSVLSIPDIALNSRNALSDRVVSLLPKEDPVRIAWEQQKTTK